MKRFKLVVPSFVALIFCALLMLGSTLALFTSKAEASISATSGKVDVDASLTDLKLFSADPSMTSGTQAGVISEGDHAGTYYYNDRTEAGSFLNSGTAVISNSNALVINKMTPGDKVTLKLDAGNNSNVNIKYRLSFNATTESDQDLLSVLLINFKNTDFGNKEYEGLKNFKSAWIEKLATAKEISDTEIEIIFPLSVESSEENEFKYENKTVAFEITLLAVQGNAATSGAETAEMVAKTVTSYENMNKSETVTAEAVATNAPASVKAEAEDSDLTVEALVPASLLSTEQENTVELKVEKVALTENNTETTSKLDFDVKLLVNNNAVTNASEPVTVKIFVGKDLVLTSVTHNGNPVPNYQYDLTTGYLTFQTNSFSPFSIEYYDALPSTYVLSVVKNEDGKTGTVTHYTVGQGTTTEQVRYLKAERAEQGGDSTDNTIFNIKCGEEVLMANTDLYHVFLDNNFLAGRNILELPEGNIYINGGGSADHQIHSDGLFMIGAKDSNNNAATTINFVGSGFAGKYGFKLFNRLEGSTLRTYYFENIVFNGSQQSAAWGHFFTFTAYNIDAQFRNVTFDSPVANRGAIFGIWANQDLTSTERGSSNGHYPTKEDNIGASVRFIDCKVVNNQYNIPVIQFQGFTSENMTSNPDCYSFIKVFFDEASGVNCGLNVNSAYITQKDNNLYDFGQHHYWAVNGKEVLSVNGTKVLVYAEQE